MSGGAPAADDEGNIYFLTGNGTFDASGSTVPGSDYGDSLVRLSSELTLSQYFTPTNQGADAYGDLDFGSGSVLLVDLPAGSPVTHLITGGGKDGNLYVLNADSLGGYGDQYAQQELAVGASLFSPPTFWNNYLFINGNGTALQSYKLDPATALFSAANSVVLVTGSYGIGSPSSVSASGTTNGILWSLNNSARCSVGATATTGKTGGPAILEAYDAANLTNLLWSSATSSADTAGYAVSFSVPTVANGKVYIGTRGMGDSACSLTSTTGELDVYGLKN